MQIFVTVLINNTMTISTDTTEDFWLEVSSTVGWIKFEKLNNEDCFTPQGAQFLATELRSASEQVPHPVVSVQGVLWSRHQAILADQAISSYQQATLMMP